MKRNILPLVEHLILVTHIGWLMALSILCGFGIGYFIYQHSDSVVLFVICILLGIAAGFFNVYRLIYKKLDSDATDYNIP